MDIASPFTYSVSTFTHRAHWSGGKILTTIHALILLSIVEFIYVYLCVCVSGYTFPHSSIYLLQILREHSKGHDTYRGLLLF
jgi:hypothetical protein